MSCLNWILEKPAFVVREIIISPRSFTEINLIFRLDVQNPNRIDLTLTSFEYTVFLNQEVIGNGHLKEENVIPSSSTTPIEAHVVARFKDLGGSLKALITGNDLPYRIEGKAEVKTVFGRIVFPFSKGGSTGEIMGFGVRDAKD